MKRVVFGFALGIGLSLGAYSIPKISSLVTPNPLTIHSIELLSRESVHAGDVIEMKAEITRLEICDAIVHRFIWAVDGGGLVFSMSLQGNRAGVGEHLQFEFSVELPPDIPPGNYRFQTIVYNDCPSGKFVTQSPSVIFKVD